MSTQTIETDIERQDWEDLLRDFLSGDVNLPEPPKTITHDVTRV